MENEFVSYEVALKLQQMGFNKECLGIYQENRLLPFGECIATLAEVDYIKAPLYQQTFDWFLDKYELYCSIYLDYGSWYFIIQEYTEKSKAVFEIQAGDDFNSYQETREKAIEKLIELCT